MKKLTILLYTIALLFLTACGSQKVKTGKNTHAMYFWQTSLRIDSAEKAFLHQHQVKKLYVRYFDVVMDGTEAMPNATLSFGDGPVFGPHGMMPDDMEVVPVIYVLNECMEQQHDGLADKILKRILQMDDTNGIRHVREIQIDCDWTMSTRKNYFAFLQRLHELCEEKHLALSTTVRLHQLSQSVPPVDRGVLMVYNTGDVTDIHERYPILNIKEVNKYLRYLPDYKLQLSAAYPLFKWKVLFRNNQYVGIIHSKDEYPILPGDSIIDRSVQMPQIMEAHNLIASLRPDIHDEVILYDLQDAHIRRFRPSDYEQIFHR